jgi:hypothetical protein
MSGMAAKKPLTVKDMKRDTFESAMSESKKERRGIQSVEVGGQLLVALVEQGSPMLLRELAQKAGMTSAKAHPTWSASAISG